MSDEQAFRFGDFELDTRAERLSRAGREVKLAPQLMRVLVLLVKRRGALVTREELHIEAWDGRHVSFDSALNFAIARLRRALGDAGPPWTFVETVPRRGYRFAGSVIPPPRRQWRRAAWAAVALMLLVTASSSRFNWSTDVVLRVLSPAVGDADRSLAQQFERDLRLGLLSQPGLVTSMKAARYAIDARIDRASAGLVITATLITGANGQPRWRAKIVARPEELPQLGRDLAADVRRAVDDPEDRRTVTIERESPAIPNLPAWNPSR